MSEAGKTEGILLGQSFDESMLLAARVAAALLARPRCCTRAAFLVFTRFVLLAVALRSSTDSFDLRPLFAQWEVVEG